MVCAGGGGFGDPIVRAPERVRLDVERGLCSAEVAARIYGVVVSGDDGAPEVDDAASEAARTEIRARRLAEGRPVGDVSTVAPPGDIAAARSIDIGRGAPARRSGAARHASGRAGDTRGRRIALPVSGAVTV